MSSPSNLDEFDLERLVEKFIEDFCDLATRGLSFRVDKIKVHGRCPASLKISATLHFQTQGSPFCCMQPGCHLGLGEDLVAALEKNIRMAIEFDHPIILDFGDRIDVDYDEGVVFRALGNAGEPPGLVW